MTGDLFQEWLHYIDRKISQTKKERSCSLWKNAVRTDPMLLCALCELHCSLLSTAKYNQKTTITRCRNNCSYGSATQNETYEVWVDLLDEGVQDIYNV